MDVNIDRYDSSEITLAKNNIDEALKILSASELLVILDRGYPSIEFFNWIEERGIKFLMRLCPKDYKQERDKMQSNDEIVEIQYTYPRLQKIKKEVTNFYEKIKEKTGIELRLTRLQINENTTEYLISNLEKEKFSENDLKELYGQRWQVEKAYDTLKNKLKIESFTGNLPIFVYQDIYAQIVVYNQSQDILYPGNKKLKKDNKDKVLTLEYNINENNAIGLYKERFIQIMLIKNRNKSIKEYDELIIEMTQYITAIRRGRSNQPRKWNISNKNRTNLKSSF